MPRLQTSSGASAHDDDASARAAIVALLTFKGVIIGALIFLILQIAGPP